MLVSIVIRTLNEATYLDELLRVIGSQIKDNFDVEVVIIDSVQQMEPLALQKVTVAE